MYKIISSGSNGNSVLYSSVLVDIGIPFSYLEKYIDNIKIILLTHKHLDHINIKTLDKLIKLRPNIRIGCCNWMIDFVKQYKNADIYEIGKLYKYDNIQISPILAYHDVPNCGYRIFINDYKILHITDTCHLEGISALNYDLYSLEANYCEEKIKSIIEYKNSNNIFSYEKGSINSHLSIQQAQDFFIKNKNDNSKLILLHQSKNNL